MHTKSLLLALFIALKFALQYLAIAPEYEVHRDEYLHLDQARHLAWGYLSVPPFTSWVSYLILLLGNGVFWVKFFPALFGALTIFVVWKTIESLGGDLFALALGATAMICSVFVRINTLYQPNSVDYLCWTFVYYAFVRYVQTEKPRWLYWAGIVFALGFLNKYNIVFLALGLVPALLMTPSRKIFTKPALYLALGLALVMISPNLYWQYSHDFPVLQHMRELSEDQLVNVSRADFFMDQILFFSGAVWVWLAALLAFWVYPPFRPYRFSFFAFLISMALFVYLRAKGYYSIGLYPILLAFGAVYFEFLLNKGWRVYLRPIVLAFPVVLFSGLAMVVLPMRSPAEIEADPAQYKSLGLLRWEDGKDHSLPQDFADMQGWRELAQKVDKVYAGLADKQGTLVFCDNYGQAGAINFYTNQGIQAVSMNADYINWINLDQPIHNIILVKESEDDDPNREAERPAFVRVETMGEIKNPFAREKGAKIYLLEGAKVPIAPILQEEIEKRKRGED
ncbi:MAG: glycosyltransferase family 39 protein [Haliscomenobacter sp.]|uniref:glycosyltransferase family 39 protein n=1 Tax=Haliscomenobacter sp. TaxID=2717303 RepID=UPI0029A2C673|nr:glycosyltransferase family 39 protein [Haliscomenobacter sp.]MDX2069301.1 glycosyltransferase family 39 protein [Haliscomenobacter sp.]